MEISFHSGNFLFSGWLHSNTSTSPIQLQCQFSIALHTTLTYLSTRAQINLNDSFMNSMSYIRINSRAKILEKVKKKELSMLPSKQCIFNRIQTNAKHWQRFLHSKELDGM